MKWPPHARQTIDWSQSRRAGTKADRMLTAIEVSIPPRIAATPTPDLASSTEREAIAAITRLDETNRSAPGAGFGALRHMLIRLESVASSKIEHLDASVEDYARAVAGSRANDSATAMVAASEAVASLVDATSPDRAITVGDLLTAHRALMRDDAHESAEAGSVRQVQNWIGGSDYAPRNALFIPPPPELVAELLDDLLVFAARSDLPPLTQAAVVHAQFESIHPFSDGNGRIGRALIQAVLRHRGLARDTVIPIASALVADQTGYFALLNAYRDGDPEPIVTGISRAATIAAEACLTLPGMLAGLPVGWHSEVRPRAGSAAAGLIELLPAHPVATASSVQSALGVSYNAANGAIATLAEVGILTPLNDRLRDRAFAAHQVLAELTDLERTIRDRVTAELRTATPTS